MRCVGILDSIGRQESKPRDHERFAVVASVMRTQMKVSLNVDRQAIQITSGGDCQEAADRTPFVVGQIPLKPVQVPPVSG